MLGMPEGFLIEEDTLRNRPNKPVWFYLNKYELVKFSIKKGTKTIALEDIRHFNDIRTHPDHLVFVLYSKTE